VPTDMEMWTEIRRRVLVEDVSKRQTRRDHGISSKTLDKVLGHTEPTRGRALFGASAGPSDPSEQQGRLPVPPSPTGTALR
jgi:hypothetical protein